MLFTKNIEVIISSEKKTVSPDNDFRWCKRFKVFVTESHLPVVCSCQKWSDRLPNWSNVERTMAIGLINDSYDQLFNKFKGSSSGATQKTKHWQGIADKLNSSGITQCMRSVEHIKRMYANVKQRAKEKECSKKKTGGGPPPNLMESEEKVIEGLQGKPQLAGIEGGVDTSKTVVEESVNSSFVIPDTVEDSANTCSSSVIPNSRQSLSVENSDNTRVKGKERKMAADNLLDLEMKRAILEIELTEQRKDKEKKMFEIKKEYQIQQLNREKIIYDLKEQVLRENLKNEFEQNYLTVQEM